MDIAFQGEFGAYSEEAVQAAFPDATPRPLPTFETVFDALTSTLTSGGVDRAVVPIENTVFGSVRVNYDRLRAHPVSIIGEVNRRIHHHLLAPPGASMEGLLTVRSHPQALGQCRAWLRANLGGTATESVTDTAGAARQVAEEHDRTVAAIASRRAADRYGLEVLAGGIEDDAANYTRFLVLAPRDADAERVGDGPLKTSIVFALRDNVPGALFKSLAVFALRDLDLLKIESRPFVGQPGRYRFYLDVRGDASQGPLRRALQHLREISTEVRSLGTYPAAPPRREA